MSSERPMNSNECFQQGGRGADSVSTYLKTANCTRDTIKNAFLFKDVNEKDLMLLVDEHMWYIRRESFVNQIKSNRLLVSKDVFASKLKIPGREQQALVLLTPGIIGLLTETNHVSVLSMVWKSKITGSQQPSYDVFELTCMNPELFRLTCKHLQNKLADERQIQEQRKRSGGCVIL